MKVPGSSPARLRDRGRPAPRGGFTLLEVILVLAVMGMVAGLSWPRLSQYLKRQGVQANAEQVRQVLARGAIRAVSEGRVLQFRYELQGDRYILLPLEPAAAAADERAIDPSVVPTATGPVETGAGFRVYKLLGECRFHVDSSLITGERTVVERLGDEWLAHLENGLEARDAAWSAPLLLHPDGTATDGRMTVMDPERRYVSLHLRGLTGGVTVDPVRTLEERLGSTEN